MTLTLPALVTRLLGTSGAGSQLLTGALLHWATRSDTAACLEQLLSGPGVNGPGVQTVLRVARRNALAALLVCVHTISRSL